MPARAAPSIQMQAAKTHPSSASADLYMNPPLSPTSSSFVDPSTALARKTAILARGSRGVLRFEDVFWGTDGSSPTDGVNALHGVFARHLGEVEDVIAIVRARIAVEESAADSLEAAGNLPPSALAGGGGGAAPRGGSSILSGFGWGKSAASPPSANGVGIGAAGNGPNSPGGGILSFWTSSSSSASSSSSSANGSGEKKGASTDATKPDDSNGAAANGPEGSPQANGQNGSTHKNDSPAADASKSESTDRSSLNSVVTMLRSQMFAMAAVHRKHADTLVLAVLSPLTAFVDQHRRALNKKKAEVDNSFKELQRISGEIEKLKGAYFAKAKIADQEEKRFQVDGEARANPPALKPVPFKNRTVGPQELQDILAKLRKDVPTKTIMTPIGLYEGCFLGEDALSYLMKMFPGVAKADVRALLQELTSCRSICPVVGGMDGRFSTALPYMFGRPVLKTGEPPHVRARRDAEVARLEYVSAVEASEHTRGALEFHITDYLVSAQEAEAYRLAVTKETMLVFESAQLFATAEMSATWATGRRRPAPSKSERDPSKNYGLDLEEDNLPETMIVCPSPTAGIQDIAERHRTGHLRTPPFVFEDAVGGRSPHQVFGIGLEELARATRRPVPTVVVQCLSALMESLEQGRSSVDTWILPNQDLTSVQFLRHEMNGGGAVSNSTKTFTVGGGAGQNGTKAAGPAVPGKAIRSAALKRYSPSVIAGVLRLYFVEAPVSLVSHELYEPLKILYTEDFERFDQETRFRPITSLLQTLTPPHYETLKLFTGYLHELVKPLEANDDRIPRLCWSLAPTILRPRQETAETLRDEAPWRFTRDLILHYPVLLSGGADVHEMLRRTPSPPPEEEGGVGLDEDEMLMAVGSGSRRWKRQSRGMSLAELRASPTKTHPPKILSMEPVEGLESNGTGAPQSVEASASSNGTATPSSGGWFPWIRRNTLTETPLSTESNSEAKGSLNSAADDKEGVSHRLASVVNKRASILATSSGKAGTAPQQTSEASAPAERSKSASSTTVVTAPAPAVVASTPSPAPGPPPTSAASELPSAADLASVPAPSPSPPPAARPKSQAGPAPAPAPPQAPQTSVAATATSAVSSIASLASSVVFGTAAAMAAAVTKPDSTSAPSSQSLPGPYASAITTPVNGSPVLGPADHEAEIARVWAQAQAEHGSEEEDVEYFDGTEMEKEDEDEMRAYLASAQDFDEYLKWG